MLLGPVELHELARPHEPEAREHGEEAERVDREADADAEGGDEDAGERGADHARAVEEARVERDRVRQLLPADHLERERVTAGRVEDERCPGGRGERVREPDDLRAGKRQCRQCQGDDHRRRLRDHDEPPVVEAVRDNARDQAENCERGEAAEGEEADRDGRVRELDDVPGERDVLHPGSDEGDDLAREEQPVVPVLAEACEGAAEGDGHSSSRSRRSGSIAASSASSSARLELLEAGREPGSAARLDRAQDALSLVGDRQASAASVPFVLSAADEPGSLEPRDVLRHRRG